MPDWPSGSSAAPFLYQTICVTTGVRASGMTTTSMPLSSVKLVMLARAGSGAAAPGASETADAFVSNDMNGLSRGRGRVVGEWFLLI